MNPEQKFKNHLVEVLTHLCNAKFNYCGVADSPETTVLNTGTVSDIEITIKIKDK